MENIRDIISGAIKTVLNNGSEEWKRLPLIAGSINMPVDTRIAYVRAYPPAIFGGYLTLVWAGKNHELILPRLSHIIRYYTVSGTAPMAISRLYDLYMGLEDCDDADENGIVSNSVDMSTGNGIIHIIYASPKVMSELGSMNNVKEAMVTYVMNILKPHMGYILYYDDVFMKHLCKKIINEDRKAYSYLRVAVMEELLKEDEPERFLPRLVLDHMYYDGYMNDLSLEVSSILQIDKVPFPDTYNGQRGLLDTAMLISGDEPHAWFEKNMPAMLAGGFMNPFITADDILK